MSTTPPAHLRSKIPKWKPILRRIETGQSFLEAISSTPWPEIHQWQRWVDLKPERQAQLDAALAKGASAQEASIQERAVAAQSAWLATVELKLVEGKALSAKEIDTLKILADSKLKGLRQSRLAPEKLPEVAGEDW